MQFGLTEEQEMIVSTVRSFVETEIYPLEDEVEKLGHVPLEMGNAIKDKVMEMGFYAPNFPESVGGGGLNNLEFALLERELGRGSMALTHFFGRPQNILMACGRPKKCVSAIDPRPSSRSRSANSRLFSPPPPTASGKLAA